jgi:hypothetical protein
MPEASLVYVRVREDESGNPHKRILIQIIIR